MINALKQFAGSILLNISPEVYKRFFYKKLLSLTWGGVLNENRNPELLYLPYFLNPEDVFFDVGANRGEYLLGANRVLEPSNIHAFEPIPALNTMLKKLFSKNHIHALAFSNEVGRATFKIPVIAGRKYDTRGTLNLDFKESGESNSIEFDVDISTVDTFVKERKIDRVNFIKIDVEGFEENVMLGAEKTINAFQPIMIVEIEKRHHKKPIKDIIVRVMETHDYAVVYFNLNERSFTELSSTDDIDAVQDEAFFKKSPALYINNLIFIPRSKVSEGFLETVNNTLQSDMNAANG